MPGHVALFLDDGDARLWMALVERGRGRQPNDARADDEDIE